MSKTFYKLLSFFFGIFCFGGIKQTYRVLTSSAPDIVSKRTYLTIMALLITGAFLSLTIYFYRKGTNKH
ncbi:hypothetical protein ES692_14145 [Psychroserpens burtonensis]|uniref:Uncharacterized protein n=1 Tax=Psychroserpens burtonensis TaxID=49278 RepID=A0A5C7B603_9FLAO|nr:hypothetical protein [Psychroserpens burtonensis]TXE16055.1 hypothetical protein ES692_14145 [Psychroserpens burtonensis]